MVLAIISACLAGALFSVAMPGIFIGGGDEHPETVSHRIITSVACDPTAVQHRCTINCLKITVYENLFIFR